ncbi:hypothetical protein [Terriglobus sp. TAA 43]|uniref:hypothetical protein n=1 Tax=Terriglobus sp. TAA 43 TaxID=278961 RepID=UPI0012ED6909|nr:hypothetical protein [Terriglobus sp. TAA 43]
MKVIEESTIVGDDEVDTVLLRDMAQRAESFLQAFKWCRNLTEGKFVDGYGGIFALFLFRADIDKIGEGVDLWVFIGDVPTAYLEAKDFPVARDAAKRYLDGVREWVVAVRNNTPLNELIPIAHAKDSQSLDELERKLDTLVSLVLPQIYNGSESKQ